MRGTVTWYEPFAARKTIVELFVNGSFAVLTDIYHEVPTGSPDSVIVTE
ncbi:MAG: hypothetical protein QXV17_15225 [Candidatus Micrarchaeaceae archaeon]